uniref:Uncharacterized protein n=1 Tax=Paenarthrobacter aurescens TaxID=43663 RepID=Q6SK36_PAEAU|nr:hypothetical protein [Paenarthrobacter aurescens]
MFRLAGLTREAVRPLARPAVRPGPVVAGLRRTRTSCVYDDAPIAVKSGRECSEERRCWSGGRIDP